MTESGNTESGDYHLGHAIRRMAQLLVPVASDLRAAAENGQSSYLLHYLRSEQSLTSVDRVYLAELLAGLVSRPPGRREASSAKSNRREAEHKFRQLRSDGIGPEDAWSQVAKDLLIEFGGNAFARHAFKPREGDVADLANRFIEWNKRPASRK